MCNETETIENNLEKKEDENNEDTKEKECDTKKMKKYFEDGFKLLAKKISDEKAEELSAQKNEYEDKLKEQEENMKKDNKKEI